MATQDWSRVSPQAKQKKVDNKKSLRDINREQSIKEMGGEPIEVQYGRPLTDTLRSERKELYWTLLYPNRKKKKGNRLERIAERQQEREALILSLGGEPIEIKDGKPLTSKESVQRSQYLSKLRKTGAWTPASKRTDQQFKVHALAKLKYKSRLEGLPFDLEPEDILLPDFCPVLGLKLDRSSSKRDDSPSFDRLIPKKGYTKENTRIISMRANRLKQDGSLDEIEALYKWLKKELDE